MRFWEVQGDHQHNSEKKSFLHQDWKWLAVTTEVPPVRSSLPWGSMGEGWGLRAHLQQSGEQSVSHLSVPGVGPANQSLSTSSHWLEGKTGPGNRKTGAAHIRKEPFTSLVSRGAFPNSWTIQINSFSWVTLNNCSMNILKSLPKQHTTAAIIKEMLGGFHHRKRFTMGFGE